MTKSCRVPDGVGGRYSVFSAVGLVPAAIVGLDVPALLLGASTMTQRFLSEPFERNPVLQYAAINYLMATELGKSTRVLAIWSKKLESLGLWHDQLLAESLGKQGIGPTPITVVNTRDLHSRGQQLQEGTRDKLINNLFIRGTHHAPIQIGMADRNEDELNQFARKTYPDILTPPTAGRIRLTPRSPARRRTSCCPPSPSTRWASSCKCSCWQPWWKAACSA